MGRVILQYPLLLWVWYPLNCYQVWVLPRSNTISFWRQASSKQIFTFTLKTNFSTFSEYFWTILSGTQISICEHLFRCIRVLFPLGKWLPSNELKEILCRVALSSKLRLNFYHGSITRIFSALWGFVLSKVNKCWCMSISQMNLMDSLSGTPISSSHSPLNINSGNGWNFIAYFVSYHMEIFIVYLFLMF